MTDNAVIDAAEPQGTLALQTFSMPKDTNANGDIFGGWLVSQMDIAAGISSKRECQGRSVTVAIKEVNFIKPVGVGDVVWDLEVRNGATDVVWQRRISSSAFGDGAWLIACRAAARASTRLRRCGARGQLAVERPSQLQL